MAPSRKRKARERVIDADYERNLYEKRLAAKGDDELFFLDTLSTVNPRKAARRAKKAVAKTNRDSFSKTETVLIDRAALKLQRRLKQQTPAKKEELDDDLWADEGRGEKMKTKQGRDGRSKRKSTPLEAMGGIATGGQSYNPKLEEHQDVVGEAVAIESRRLAKLESLENWWQNRLKKLNEEVDEEDDKDDEEEEEEQEEKSGEVLVRRPTEPVTRTKRNKQRRARAAEAEVRRKERVKSQRRQLDTLKHIRKDIEAEERKLEDRRAKIASEKTSNPRVPEPRAPPHVALSDELLASEGTLRKSTSLQTPSTLLRLFRDGDALAKHRPASKLVLKERKKPPRRKFRGAKIIARYRTNWQ